eukprot:c22360_g1_i1 orf=13-267(+)
MSICTTLESFAQLMPLGKLQASVNNSPYRWGLYISTYIIPHYKLLLHLSSFTSNMSEASTLVTPATPFLNPHEEYIHPHDAKYI